MADSPAGGLGTITALLKAEKEAKQVVEQARVERRQQLKRAEKMQRDHTSVQQEIILASKLYYCLCVAYSSKSEQSNTAQKVSRVLYIAHKALLADSRCIEALLLKASALCSKEVNRPNEALDHYKEAQKWRSWCFEAYSDHVKLLLSGFSMRTPISKDMKEMSGGGTIHNPALVTAFQSIKKCGKSARTLTLLAKAFRNEPLASKDRATATIDKALELDPKYTPAIILKADLLLAETKKPPLSQPSSSAGPNEAAINFLKTKLDTFPESAIVIHEKLASIYANLNQKDEEVIHKNIVMSLSRMPHDGSDVAGTGFGSLSCRIEDDFQPLDPVGTGYGNFSMDMDTSIGLSGRSMTGGTGNGWHAVGMTGTAANDSDLSFD
ncbi:anaphase-promoting complex subunit 7-like [Convolutriloba macropyga]|uniref:anaphase-promoting complex subunit 7-like n=1 Tax=Convolutriloba macropyga TaxID=536237 RepID=UPI003F520160